jgi:hypothetical protein
MAWSAAKTSRSCGVHNATIASRLMAPSSSSVFLPGSRRADGFAHFALHLQNNVHGRLRCAQDLHLAVHASPLAGSHEHPACFALDFPGRALPYCFSSSSRGGPASAPRVPRCCNSSAFPMCPAVTAVPSTVVIGTP